MTNHLSRKRQFASARLFVLVLLTFVANCTQASVKVSESRQAQALCMKVAEIKTIPLKSYQFPASAFRQSQTIYGKFRKLGDAAVPCLIEKMTDETEMEDPRQSPRYRPVTVGDTAFWVIMDITGMEYESVLPKEVTSKFDEIGMYAYFDWVRDPANRKMLQENLKAQYEAKKRKLSGKKTISPNR